MNKRLTVVNTDGVNVLHQNGKPAKCPFLNPFPMPHHITGRVDFQVPICSSECLFFNLVTIENNQGDKLETVFFDCVGCSKTLTP